MADPAVVLLAAGLSRRYGAVGKLVADYRGKPLALHIADTLSGVRLSQRIAVCRSGDDDLSALLRDRGFTIVLNPDTARGLASSLALGIKAVRTDAAIVCLADMPNVSARHLNALIDAGRADGVATSATADGPPTPPAYFGRAHFADLMGLEGDKGARGLVGDAQRVIASPGELTDFDTPADFR